MFSNEIVLLHLIEQWYWMNNFPVVPTLNFMVQIVIIYTSEPRTFGETSASHLVYNFASKWISILTWDVLDRNIELKLYSSIHQVMLNLIPPYIRLYESSLTGQMSPTKVLTLRRFIVKMAWTSRCLLQLFTTIIVCLLVQWEQGYSTVWLKPYS